MWLVRLLLLSLLFGRGVAAGADPEVLLAAGDPSPLGLPFSTFPAVAVDEQARVIVLGSSSGAFRRSRDGLVHLLAAGEVLPSGRVVAGVGAVAAAPGGCAVMRASLVGGGAGLFRRCAAGLERLVETGTPVPGGGTLVDLTGGVAANGPHAAFAALLDDGRTVLLRATGTVLTRVVTTGDLPPSGGTITALRLAGVADDGRVGFRGSVNGGRDGYFTGDGTSLLAVVLAGDAVGGLGASGSMGTLGGAAMNRAGTFAFRAVLNTRDANLDGIFRVDGSAASPRVEPLGLEGGSTGEAGVSFRGFASSVVPSINAGGVVAFRGNLTGDVSGSAVFVSAGSGVLARVVGTRDVTDAGALVRLRDPAIADDGSICIPASITGRGPGLFVYRGGSFVAEPLAQIGDRTDLDTGQERFRFTTPSAGATAEEAVFLGSREGIFRVGADRRIQTLAFVGQPTPLRGTYAVLDPPAAGGAAVAFGAEIRDGQASRALVRVTPAGAPRLLVAATARGPGGGRFVDFFAGAIDSQERPDVGPGDDVAFEATMQGGRFSRGVFRRAGSRVQLVAGAGRRAPGGGTYQAFGSPAVVRGARVAFVAQVETQGERAQALLLLRGRRGSRLASQGDAVSGRLSGHVSVLDAPDATDRMVVWRATLAEQAREGVFARPIRGGSTALLAGTGDAAPGGGVLRSFERPMATARGVAFLARLQGGAQPPSLYLARATAVPPPNAPAPALERLLGPGSPTPLGGTVSQVTVVDANRAGTVVAAVELVGARAPSALLLVPMLP